MQDSTWIHCWSGQNSPVGPVGWVGPVGTMGPMGPVGPVGRVGSVGPMEPMEPMEPVILYVGHNRKNNYFDDIFGQINTLWLRYAVLHKCGHTSQGAYPVSALQY